MDTRGTIFGETNRLQYSGEFHSVPIGDGTAKWGDRIDFNNNYETGHANFTPSHPAPCSPSAVTSVADQSFETRENPINIRSTPSCAVDYWFEQLGLSLGPTPPENPSDPTRFLAQSTLGDSVNDVSLLLVVYSRRLPLDLRII